MAAKKHSGFFLLLLTAGLFALPTESVAQEETRSWWVKVNPFGLFAGQFQASYEQAVIQSDFSSDDSGCGQGQLGTQHQ